MPKVRAFLKMVDRFIELSIDAMEFEARNTRDLHKQLYYERLREELKSTTVNVNKLKIRKKE